MAGVVIAIADQNDCAAYSSSLRRLQQLVAACVIERVVHRGAAAGTEHAHTLGQGLGTVGEVLRNFRSYIKAHYECPVVSGPDGLVQKLDRGLLLELETVADGVAGVNQKPDLHRQISLAAKTADFRYRLFVIDDPEIALGEVLDVVIVLVRDGKNHTDLIHGDDEDWAVRIAVFLVLLGRSTIGVIIRFRGGYLLGRCLWRLT